MMTNTELREKLVELLCLGANKAEICNSHEDCSTAIGDCGFCTIIADYLIANGVTFAADKNDGGKWISVDERLPEENGEYLISFLYKGVEMNELVAKSVWMNSESLTPEERGKFPLGCFHVQSMSNVKVTLWMPLPSLPKEE